MRILITGAQGLLGQALAPRLEGRGDEVVRLDVRAGRQGDVVGDVRDAATVSEAMRGIDVVVHAAAWHGIHLRDRTPREFYDLNVTGTFNVWQAAIEERVKGVVFCSTMGVYGRSRVPARSDEVVLVGEDLPLLPTDVYGWSKVVGEELCRYALRDERVPSVALRFGMFVPETFFRFGIRLLYGGVQVDDAAGAAMAAADALVGGSVGHEALNVESPLRFRPEDGSLLRRDPLAAVERRYSGARRLLEERGVRSLREITEVFDVARLGDRLGFVPGTDFSGWIEELRRRPDERAADEPPWP